MSLQTTYQTSAFAVLAKATKRTLGHYRKPLSAIAALGAVVLFVDHSQLDDLAMRHIAEMTTPDMTQGQSIWLNSYTHTGDPIVISGISELSGLTWNNDSKTLFAVLNRPPRAIEMDRDGKIFRTFMLNGFQDVEGITWVGGDRFLIADERRHNIIQVDLGINTTEVNYDEEKQLRIGIGTGKNKGFEGIAWQPDQDSIWIAKERDPMAIYQITGAFSSSDSPQIDIHHNTEITSAASSGNTDLSGLHYDTKSGNLLVLSDESARIAEVNLKGEVVSTMSMGWLLGENVPQAEGITMNDEGDIFVASEPNLLYRYSKQQSQGEAALAAVQ